MYTKDNRQYTGIKTLVLIDSIVLIIIMSIISGITAATDEPYILFDETRASARYTDLDPNSNNFAPNITLLSNPTPEIWNDGNDFIMLAVMVSDEDKDPGGGATTGGDISSVTTDLSELGGPASRPMFDDGTNGDVTVGDNIWSLMLSTSTAGGWYKIYFKAYDNGTATEGGQKWNDTSGQSSEGQWDSPGWYLNLTVKQINRAPVAIPDYMVIKFDEDSYNSLDLNSVFSDPDNDPLTYCYDAAHEMNISIFLTGSMVNISSIPNWCGECFFTVTANDTSTRPNGYLTAELKIKVRVLSVNDDPVFNETNEWDFNANVTLDGNTFTGDEDTEWYIKGYAWDWDTLNADNPDKLEYSIENSEELPTSFNCYSHAGGFVFEFTPTNDDVGSYQLNLSVTDGSTYTNKYIYFHIMNTNDEPYISKIIVKEQTVIVNDNYAFLGKDLSATEEEIYNFTVVAIDVDAGADESLIFKLYPYFNGPNQIVTGTSAASFNLTPTDSDGNRGYILANVTVADSTGTGIDDFAIVNISVMNKNDPPIITKIHDETPDPSGYEDRGSIREVDFDNFSITIFDKDNDQVKIYSNNNDISIEDAGDGTYQISFKPSEPGNITAQIIIDDGFDKVTYTFFWEVEKIYLPPPNEPPTLSITTGSGTSYRLGDEIIIKGRLSDPNPGEIVKILVEIVFPGDNAEGIYGPISEIDSSNEVYWIKYNNDGTWKFIYDTQKILNIIELLNIDTMVTDLEGNYRFIFIAEDAHGAQSQPVEVSVEVKEQSSDKPKNDPLTMGFFKYDMLVIAFLVITIIFILLAVFAWQGSPFGRWQKSEIMEVSELPLPPPPPPPPKGHPASSKHTIRNASPDTESTVAIFESSDREFVSCPGCDSWIPVSENECPGCGYPLEGSEVKWDFEAEPGDSKAVFTEVIPPDKNFEKKDTQPILDICPSCGENVPAGEGMCRHCGHYFDTM